MTATAQTSHQIIVHSSFLFYQLHKLRVAVYDIVLDLVRRNFGKKLNLYDRIAGEIEFCNIAISREAAACCSHGRKPMDLLAYIAEVLKRRHRIF